MKKIIAPNVRTFTVKYLEENIQVPSYQRWLVENNIEDLRESISAVGLLRSPIICHVKDENLDYIIDGNHLRHVIINSADFKPDDEILCIYREVDTLSDAGIIFKFLNTKGRPLDMIDITKLYSDIHGEQSVYAVIWAGVLGSPKNLTELRGRGEKFKSLSIPSIIEFLVQDKTKYRNGEFKEVLDTKSLPNFLGRKALLMYLLEYSQTKWNAEFKDGKKPNGNSINGFANLWFSKAKCIDGTTLQLSTRYAESDFLYFVTAIYKLRQKELASGFLLNRDNAGIIFKTYLNEHQGHNFVV